ncbi:MAG: hypothetical protein ACWA5L_04220 [bacterium]
MRFISNIYAWILASVSAYLLASFFSTEFVLAGLGVKVSLMDNITSVMRDIVGLYAYLLVMALGFALAFFVASIVKAFLPFLSVIAYPVAGAAAILTILQIMQAQFDVIPISGALSQAGLVAQLMAGAMGGVVFEWMRPK